MRWRRRVNRALSPLGLTFTQWLLLQTMRELIDETRDAVSLMDITKRSGVDKTTVSQVMMRLFKHNLISIGPAAQWPGSRS
jgi:DNA-binding MarR family transcriptional regulator